MDYKQAKLVKRIKRARATDPDDIIILKDDGFEILDDSDDYYNLAELYNKLNRG